MVFARPNDPHGPEPGATEVAADDVRELIADEDGRFEIDPRLSDEEREDHARMQLGIRSEEQHV